jgi:hypothetical protein
VLPAGYFENGKLQNSHGYSDSTADLPMLALCQKVTVVNPSAALEQLAHAKDWQIVRPPRPWKSKAGFAKRALLLLLGLGSLPMI